MLLIADSGSTKTDWLLLEKEKEVITLKTIGFNPYFVDTYQVVAEINKEFSGKVNFSDIREIYFYGSGCSSTSKKNVIKDALEKLFPNASNYVEHDLLGAARALLGNKKGIAGILGTGSNSCLYDGRDVQATIFSLGYMFGDEGSGAHLGKSYVALHLKKKVPAEIYKAFEEYSGLSPEDILTRVYKEPHPNRFLASFSIFLKNQISHPFIADLVENCFYEFFREQVCHYPDYTALPFCFIGSVGYNFHDQLQEAAARHGITTGRYMSSPMEGLKEYHQNNKVVS